LNCIILSNQTNMCVDILGFMNLKNSVRLNRVLLIGLLVLMGFTANAQFTDFACSGSANTPFQRPAESPLITYTWGMPTVVPVGAISSGLSTGIGLPNISATLVNSTTSDAIVTYNVTASDATTFTYTLTVKPKPVASNQTTTICGNGTIVFSPSNVSGTVYSWGLPTTLFGTYGSATTGTNAVSFSQTLTNGSTTFAGAQYTVTPIANGCSGNTFTVTATINPTPAVSNTSLSAICSGSAFSFSPTGVPVSTSYSWSNPIVSPVSGLAGVSAQSGQPFISQTLSSSNNLVNTAIYTVTPATPTCIGNTFTVTVPVNPVPSVPNLSTTICSGNTFSFTPASPTTVPTGTTYTWTAPVVSPFGALGAVGANSTSSASISQTPINTTTSVAQAVYTVTPLYSGCAGTPFTATVTVNPSTNLTSVTTAPAICSGSVFNYTPTASTPGSTISWARGLITGISNAAAIGTGNPAETLINTTSAPITVTYVYTVTTPAGCSGTTNVTVIVNPIPTLLSTLTPTAACSGTTFNYNATSATAGVTFSWSRAAVTGISNLATTGSGDISETLVNTTNAAITVGYVYTLTNPTSGCTNTQTVSVVVNPIPVVSNQTLTNCSGSLFNLIPTGVPLGTTYTWSVPVSAPLSVISGTSGTAASSISQTLTNSTVNPATATYTITPSVGGCAGASFTLIVTVNPVATIAPQVLAPVCSGTAFSTSWNNLFLVQSSYQPSFRVNRRFSSNSSNPDYTNIK
jgi:hypothetical protein